MPTRTYKGADQMPSATPEVTNEMLDRARQESSYQPST